MPIFAAKAASMDWLREAMTSSPTITSSAKTLPRRRSPKAILTRSPSFMAVTFKPLRVPQSISLTITSWETSTSRRVKYPESAVLKAVSTSPLRAP
ncbi:hypothetical protein CY0110_19432 [Crocosphaera chwakensis CCY0110]|uniref:Uncharacterized protein n=1 Tax=Crocosphaera chwakensis CCY0110 TaxID=391612 RepID=A3IJL8_9CHRO|nr:hypothetical protein CY0110_19432 [Crocosphaera chwakensis CCY0110]